MDKVKACQHLRNVLRHRLTAWDESLLAEKLLGQDVDTSSDSVESALAGLDAPGDVDSLSDQEILEIFEVEA